MALTWLAALQTDPQTGPFLRRGPSLPMLGSLILLGSLVGCARLEPVMPLDDERVDAGGDGAHVAQGPGADTDAATFDAADAAGNTLNLCDVHKLKINELSTGGTNGSTDEFIELYNPCSATVSLLGATLVYRASTSGGDNFTFATFPSMSVPSHGYFVVANGNFTGTADMKPFQGGGGMAVAGGGIALRDAQDAVVDSIGWGTAVNAFVEGTVAPAPSTTQTLARTPNGTDTNNNLADFALATPTPGAAN